MVTKRYDKNNAPASATQRNTSVARYDEGGAPTWSASPTPIARKETPVSAPAPSGASSVPGGSNATYDTGDGVIRQGYIKGGLTYTDPNYTQRVPMGSTVYAPNGNSYKMGVSSGAPTMQTISNNYGGYTQAMLDAYAAKAAAGDEAIDARAREAVDRVEQSRKKVYDAHNQAGHDAYSAYLMASNPYGVAAQRRAAIGLNNSGLSESSQLALSADYQNALTEAELAKLEALTELSNQEKDILTEASANKASLAEARAQNAASMGMQRAGNLASLELEGSNQMYSEKRDAISDAWKQKEWDYMTSQDNRNYALGLLEMGIPVENAARILGVPQEYIDDWIALIQSEWAAQRAQNGYNMRRYNDSGSGVSSSSSSKGRRGGDVVESEETESRAFNDEDGDGVANMVGENNSWIYVAGLGRMTPTELEKLVDDPKSGVEEVVDENGVIAYIKR